MNFFWESRLTQSLLDFLKNSSPQSKPLKFQVRIPSLEFFHPSYQNHFLLRKSFYKLKSFILTPFHYFCGKLVVVSSNYPLKLFDLLGHFFYHEYSPPVLIQKFVRWLFDKIGPVEALELEKALKAHSARDALGTPPFDQWCNYEFHLIFNRKKSSEEWLKQPFFISINGTKIEGEFVFKKSFLEEKRWTLFSLGNGELFQFRRNCKDTYQYLKTIKSNAVFFNYPGVGRSQSWPKQPLILQAFYSLLKILEDSQKGLNAQEIICYGWSLGAGVQSEATQYYTFSPHIKYIFIKDRTFYNLKRTVVDVAGSILAKLSSFSKWSLNSFSSSILLAQHNIPEIIIQCGYMAYESTIHPPTDCYYPLKNLAQIRDDEIITKSASLAKKILSTKGFPQKNQILLITKENHAGKFYLQPLTDTIKNLLKKD